MTKKRAKSPSKRRPLPNQGDVFLMPLADGRFGACRVIRQSNADERIFQGRNHVLAAASSWIGNEPIEIADPRLREILVLTHHAWAGQLETSWLSDPVPDSFKSLGFIQPTDVEERMECMSYGAWEAFALQVYLQWKWDNEREKVLQEDEQKKELEKRKSEESAKYRQEYLANLTLDSLRKKRRFSEWKGFVPDKVITACRKVFRQTIDSLISAGPNPKKRAVIDFFRHCVERLNELDQDHNFIETIAREDLCEEIDEIVHACRLRGCANLADRWRDW